MSADPSEPHDAHEPAVRTRFRLSDACFLCALILACAVVAWFDVRGLKGDRVAYYDLSNAVRQHRWADCFNASWFPLYPAVLTLGRALFHFDPRYAAAAGRLVNIVLALAMFAASYFLALSVRRYALARRIGGSMVLSHASLMVWMTAFAFFLWASDMGGQGPDTLLTTLLLLATGLLVRGLTCARWSPFLLAGLAAGCAYWAKSFAFPFVGLLVLFLMISQWKNRRALLQLAATAFVFLAVSAPYIARISTRKHRFTIGDAGRLNSAWYVNGADRLNPVADPAIDDMASSKGVYKHPAELLASSPEIAYFPPGRVFGAMPAWDDFSYWSDGLYSQFVPMQTFHIVVANTEMLLKVIPMRIQLLALFAALWIFGLRLYPRQTLDPTLLAVLASAAVSLALYLLVHFEGRYIVFAAVICGAIFAAAAHTRVRSLETVRLHRVLLLIACVLLVAEVQSTLRAVRSGTSGDRPASARFDTAELAAGQGLATRFGPHAQFACLGTEACYNDSLWAWYGDLTISAVVTIPHRHDAAPTTEVCKALMHSGQVSFDALRARRLRAVVADFGDNPACSTEWQAIPNARGYFVLAL